MPSSLTKLRSHHGVVQDFAIGGASARLGAVLKTFFGEVEIKTLPHGGINNSLGRIRT